MLRRSFIVVVTVLLIAVIAHRFAFRRKELVMQPIIAAQPATKPTTTRRTPKPKIPTYMEVVQLENIAVPTTQPLDFPLDLPDSAHLILHDPVYLDPIGNIWITRADGQPTKAALANAANVTEHIITDRPVFMHWSQDDQGNWAAAAIVRSPSGFDILTKTTRQHFADDRSYQWKSAFSFANHIVVHTDVGVSVFDVTPKLQEHYHTLPGCSSQTNPPVMMLDTRGVLAWSPWETGHAGSNGVCRFVDGNWTDLPSADWPTKPIQLLLLLDGSVLCIDAGDDDQIRLTINQLQSSDLDEKHVNDLIAQLSDPDADQRQAAFDELSRYGPAIAPLLEKVEDDQLPEAKMRIHHLLGNKITPALGGIIPVDKRLEVVGRYPDGTVLFFAPVGVQIPTETDEPEVINPAWLSLKPDGRMSRPLPAALIGDQKPDACTLLPFHDEWLSNDGGGTKRLVGSSFEPLLSNSEKRFSELAGIGLGYRWVFSDPQNGDTLIIDPRIADPTPKLPVWTVVTPKGTVGWDDENFPAVARAEQGGTWSLQADGWKAVTPPNKLHAELAPATNPADVPLLVTSDGTRYFDGKKSLIQLGKTGIKVMWPLPAMAIGSSDPTLLQTTDGRLFLYNEPGRLLRIRSTPGAAQPFKLEATFTTDIPNFDPLRIWLDPAGRIDFIADENVLTIAFPDGHVPKEISRMMLDEKH